MINSFAAARRLFLTAAKRVENAPGSHKMGDYFHYPDVICGAFGLTPSLTRI